MTTITLNLSTELDDRLRIEAAKQGIAPDLYILKTLQERLAPEVTPTEADLLQQINLGFSAQTWAEYHDLISKRQAETLTPQEHEQLIQLSNYLERQNVVRIRALSQLATLRNQSLDELMQHLGLNLNSEAVDYA
jgi:hypothetical protein